MRRRNAFQRAVPGAVAILLLVALAAPATVTADTWPAGTACQGFDLRIDVGAQAGRSKWIQFTDADGNLVRGMQVGTGTALTFTNTTSGESMSTRSNASLAFMEPNADGTKMTFLGHMIVIQFPTDVPPGPWVRLFVGRTVYQVAADGTWTLTSFSGNATDICAVLS